MFSIAFGLAFCSPLLFLLKPLPAPPVEPGVYFDYKKSTKQEQCLALCRKRINLLGKCTQQCIFRFWFSAVQLICVQYTIFFFHCQYFFKKQNETVTVSARWRALPPRSGVRRAWKAGTAPHRESSPPSLQAYPP